MLGIKVSCISNISRLMTSSLKITQSTRPIIYLGEKRFSSMKNDEKVKKISPAEELRENWEPIYRFPKIRTVSSLNKLKNYQLAATIIGIPLTYCFFTEHLLVVGYTGSSLVLTFSLLSYLLKNSIGFIYVNKTNSDLVRIAYLNFWGSRCDSQFKIEDITPFSDLPKSLTDKFFTSLKFNNGHENLKLLSKDVEILNNEHFTRIFGE